MSGTPSRRWLLSLVVVVLVLGLFVPAASGHAYLSETSPGEGEQLEESPTEIELQYTGDGIQTAEVEIVGPDGADVSDEAAIDPDDRQVVTVPLEDDGEGLYIVEWEVLADDGHTTTGTFFFSVGDEAPDRETVLELYESDGEEEFSWLESGAKGLVLLSLIGLVGVPVTMWTSVYPALSGTAVSRSVPESSARKLLAGSSLLLLTGVVGMGVVQGLEDGSFSTTAFETYLGTSLGTVWLLQFAVSALLAVGLAVSLRRSVPRRLLLAGSAVGGTAVTLGVSWTSHSATMIGRLQGVITDFGHVGGAALWVGGLLTLALVVPGVLARTDEEHRRSVAATAIRRFSVVALVGVTLAVASGLVLTAWHVPDLESLLETLYGTTLSVKTALVLLGLGLGGFTRYVLLIRLRTADDESAGTSGSEDNSVRTFVHGVRLEAGILVVVILLSGLLTSAPTAALAGGDDGPEQATIEREGEEVDLEMTVLPAENAAELIQLEESEPVVFDVQFDTADGPPSEIEDPTLTFHHDDQTLEVDLEEGENGTYSAVQPLPDRFDWELRLDAWVDGTYVTEWFDVYAVPDDGGADHGEHDHGEQDDHGEHDHGEQDDHGEHDHGEQDDHGDHDHGEQADHEADESGPFTLLLQFGAVAVAVAGTVAVSIEATRTR